MSDTGFTVVACVNDDDVLAKNLLLSPGLSAVGRNQLILKRGYPSASLAYNSAIDEAANDVIIFVHQDVYLPDTWFDDLRRCLDIFSTRRERWGVLGCFGSRKGAMVGLGRVYTRGLGYHGEKLSAPEPVETLDEIVLIIRRSAGLRFDPGLPHYHLYGPDLCMTARKQGMVNYAFQAFCVHNTNQLLVLPPEFYQCYHYIRRKWASQLPIYTSCMTISSTNLPLYRKRLSEMVQRFVRNVEKREVRVEDPRLFARNE